MRKAVLGSLAIAACFVVSVALAGDEPANNKKAGPPRGQPRSPDGLFQRLDANHDGQISADEIPEGAPSHLTAMLREADKNGDKQVSPAELGQAFRRQHGRQGPPAAGPGASQDRPGSHRGRPSPDAKSGPPRRGHPAPPRPAAARGESDRPGRPAASAGRPGRPAAGRPRPPFAAGGPGAPDLGHVFKRLDTNHDGSLDPAEFAAGMQRFHAAIRASGRGPGPGPGMRGHGPGRGPRPGMRGPGPGRGPMAGRGFGPMAGRGPVDRRAMEARMQAFRAQREKAAAQSKAKAAPTRQRVEAARRQKAQQKTDRPATDRRSAEAAKRAAPAKKAEGSGTR